MIRERVRIRETEDESGLGCVVRIIPTGHRLHPGGTIHVIWECYRRRTRRPWTHLEIELRRRATDQPWTLVGYDLLDYLPGVATMPLLEAVRLHHRTQMQHAQRGRTAGIAALDIYREIA